MLTQNPTFIQKLCYRRHRFTAFDEPTVDLPDDSNFPWWAWYEDHPVGQEAFLLTAAQNELWLPILIDQETAEAEASCASLSKTVFN
jgi:hypothetical protein